MRAQGHAAAVTAAGLPAIRLHGLRRTMATLGVAAGASLNYVRDHLGYATVRTTERYAHVDDEAHREIPERSPRGCDG